MTGPLCCITKRRPVDFASLHRNYSASLSTSQTFRAEDETASCSGKRWKRRLEHGAQGDPLRVLGSRKPGTPCGTGTLAAVAAAFSKTRSRGNRDLPRCQLGVCDTQLGGNAL
jgi:hypothetical protein